MATFAQLEEVLREEFLYDNVEPARFSPSALLRLLRESESIACRSGACELIYDDTLTLTIVAGTSYYSVDAAVDATPDTVGSSILKLERVIWSAESGDIVLEKTSVDALEEFENGTWRSASDDSPSRYFVKGRTLCLDRAPTADDVTQDATLNLEVYREPKDPDRLSPEIDSRFHYALCYWPAWRCQQAPDQKDDDRDLAAQNLALFEQRFGKPVDYHTLTYLLESAGHLQVSTGDDYTDIYRRSGTDWLRELR